LFEAESIHNDASSSHLDSNPDLEWSYVALSSHFPLI